MPLTPLNDGIFLHDFFDALAEPLAAVEDEQHFVFELEAAVLERQQKLFADFVVLRAGFNKTKENLVAVDGHAEGDDDFILSERFDIH